MMLHPKQLIALLFFITGAVSSYAQDAAFFSSTISKPTNIPLQGWNKTLMLRDGSTFVLHIAPWEKMLVKVYDSLQQERISVRQIFKVINEKELDHCQFKGLYDIGNKPVLFMEQSVNSKNSLVRVEFDPVTGLIKNEIIMCTSPSALDEASYIVSKSKEGDDYAVLHVYHDLLLHHSFKISFWNDRHQKTKEALIPLPEDPMSHVSFMGFTHDSATGTYAAFSLFAPSEVKDQTDNYLLVAGLQGNDTVFRTQMISFRNKAKLKHGIIQYNPFSATVDIGVSCSYSLAKYRAGTDSRLTYLVVLDKNTLAPQTIKQISHGKIHAIDGDTTEVEAMNGVLVRMLTNKYGITTMVTESMYMRSAGKYNTASSTMLGPLSFKRFDANGEELTALAFPKMQFVNNRLYPEELAWRGTNKFLFRDMPDQAYDNQFPSFECITIRSLNYLLFNDNSSNYTDKPDDKIAPVRYFDHSEAVCYRINSTNEIQRNYLFGMPDSNSSKSLMLESIDIHAAQKKFSALVSIRNGKEKHLCVAWCTLQ